MTKVIIIQGGSLDSYYEQTLNYLHQKYHNYPSNLKDLHVDPKVMGEMAMYERLVEQSASEHVCDPGLPSGKIIL